MSSPSLEFSLKLPIYLDYAATTPVEHRVAEKMCQYLTREGIFGNPASRTHAFGWSAAQAVEQAREQVASLVNAESREIIWTSGATESNNLAIKGVAHYYRKKGHHLITSKSEHKAVLDVCRQLEREGFTVTYLNPAGNGLIDPDKLAAELRDDTVLVSIMHVNNETGVIQDLAAIGEVVRDRGVFFHVDAAQSAGKLPIDLQVLPVDLMSFSAHKIYGPKGIGALYVRHKPRVRLVAQIHGGAHERGLRAGTLAPHQIVAMGEAFRIAGMEMAADNQRIIELRNRLWNGLQTLQETYLNGDLTQRVAGILNISFKGVEVESLIITLNKSIAVSAGSACTSANPEPSHVLQAMELSKELADNAIRFSIGRFTRLEEIDYTIEIVKNAVNKLRDISPLWETGQRDRISSPVKWII